MSTLRLDSVSEDFFNPSPEELAEIDSILAQLEAEGVEPISEEDLTIMTTRLMESIRKLHEKETETS